MATAIVRSIPCLAVLLAAAACETKVSSSGGQVSVTNAPGGTSATVDTSGAGSTPTTPTTTTPATTPTDTTTTPPPADPPPETPPAGNPAVTHLDAEIKGTIDAAKVGEVAAKLEPELLTCYQAELGRKPGFTAKITIRYIVGSHGKIMSADVVDHVPDGDFATCLSTAAKKAVWPKLGGGKSATISVPFDFAIK